ncbi:MAG: hypothetical protein AAGF73_15620 [Actinomycetota bacterium]
MTAPPSEPLDGPTFDTTTPTLLLDQPATDVEVVVADLDGRVVAESGLITGDEWVVTDGALAPGAGYEWSVFAPTGSTTAGVGVPTIGHDGSVSGDMGFGSSSAEYVMEQAPQAFNVDSTAEAGSGRNGLSGEFFPHFDPTAQVEVDEDGEPVPPLPSAIAPGPGSQLVTNTADWGLVDEDLDSCPVVERAVKPIPGELPGPLIYETIEATVCEFSYAIKAEATITVESGEAAAHNVQGHNVAPAFSTTIDSDVAIDDGFVVSTADENVISAGFPLLTEFGFRSLGYLTVPETGEYQFGTQSPGGAEAFIYITTEDDLGKTRISQNDSWLPSTLGQKYTTQTETFSFENREQSSSTGADAVYYYRYRTYEYADDDGSWLQPAPLDVRSLVNDLRANGPRADHVRYGDPVHLEAGRAYPIAFTGWVGPLPGVIGLHVDSPNTGQTPVPLSWLTPAPAGTVDFDRTMGSATTETYGVAAAISGHGDTLGVLDGDGHLHISTTDTGYSWDQLTTIPNIAAPTPTYLSSIEYTVEPSTSSGWGNEPYEYANVLGDVRADFVDGELRIAGGPIELGHPSFPGLTVIDDFDVRFELDGTFTTGSVTGSTPMKTTGPNGEPYTGPNQNGRVQLDSVTTATLSPDTGRASIVFEDAGWLGREGRDDNRVVIQLSIDLDEPLRPGATSMAFDDAGTTLVAVLDRPIDGADTIEFGDSDYILNTTGESTTAGHGTITTATGDIDIRLNAGRYTLTAANLELDGPDLAEPIAIDHLEVDLFATGDLDSGEVTGTFVGGPDNNEVFDLNFVNAGSFNPATGVITTSLIDNTKGAHGYWALTHLVFEPQQTATPDLTLDVALITNTEPDQPWNTQHTEVTSLNTLLNDAGIELPSLGNRNNAAQSVHISSDGNTAAVVQPAGDHDRVIIVDRDSNTTDWNVIGEFPIELDENLVRTTVTTPVSVGRDFDIRFLAIGEGSSVTIRQWTPDDGWTITETLDVDDIVASLSLDYFAEHLAVGIPNSGLVSIFTKPWWRTNWTHHDDIEQPDGFGAHVGYTWKRLTITSADSEQVRVYRDSATQPWNNHADWSQSTVNGIGEQMVATTGGLDFSETRTVATRLDIHDPWTRFYHHDHAPIGGFAQLTTFLR